MVAAASRDRQSAGAPLTHPTVKRPEPSAGNKLLPDQKWSTRSAGLREDEGGGRELDTQLCLRDVHARESTGPQVIRGGLVARGRRLGPCRGLQHSIRVVEFDMKHEAPSIKAANPPAP